MKRHHQNHVCSSAFTLVELLVVITIITLLIAMLLPSLSRARDAANLAQCSSNQRQLAMAFNVYSSDWKGSAPLVLYSGNTALWMTQILPYLAVPNVQTGVWVPSVVKVFQCPSTFGKMVIWADQSYAPNSFFVWQRDNDQYQFTAAAWWATQTLDGPVRIDGPKLRGRQSEFVLTGESVSYDWLVPSWNAMHMYDFLHLKQRVFSFIDGHASASGPDVNYVIAVQNNGDFSLGRNNHPGSGEP